MHTILGANGVIARELSLQLRQSTDRIRQVSRSPGRVNTTAELFSADLLMDEVKRGELRGMIVRAADFHGPGVVSSVAHAFVIEREGIAATLNA